MEKEARKLLQDIYGYENFRKGQKIILDSVFQGKEVLGILTTGGGKSICYQIPALLFEGLTLVISPLISLIKDQVDALKMVGVKSAFLNSTLKPEEYRRLVGKVIRGEIKILYVTPERLLNENFVTLMQKIKISLLAVDEAHCISQWGHDFRKSYLGIPNFIGKLRQKVQILALTATATPKVQEDILEKLNIPNASIYQGSFNRKNLYFRVERGKVPEAYVADYLKKSQGEAGIVYCSTRKSVDSMYSYLKEIRGYSVGKYHGGMEKQEREESQNNFLQDKLQVMVATNAFGMGIDKSNVRFVIHANLPGDLESYYQEAGRAGRDGGQAEAILLYQEEDIATQRFFIEKNEEMEEDFKKEKLHKLDKMIEYAELESCYREFILSYFGEARVKNYCGFCGNCKKQKDVQDFSLEAKKILSCIGRAKENIGQSTVANILLGKADSKMKYKGLDKLSTFGIMKEKEIAWLEDFIHYLLAEGYMAQTAGSFPVLKLNSQSWEILQDRRKVLRKEEEEVRFSMRRNPLFRKLLRLRLEIAEREKVAPYIIFSDLTLWEFSQFRPRTKYDMMKIQGVGNQKFSQYGEEFLACILQEEE